MLPAPAGREASTGVGAFVYERHRPERTLLYQLIQEDYPAFKDYLMAQGRALPGYVKQEFDHFKAKGGRTCLTLRISLKKHQITLAIHPRLLFFARKYLVKKKPGSLCSVKGPNVVPKLTIDAKISAVFSWQMSLSQ